MTTLGDTWRPSVIRGDTPRTSTGEQSELPGLDDSTPAALAGMTIRGIGSPRPIRRYAFLRRRSLPLVTFPATDYDRALQAHLCRPRVTRTRSIHDRCARAGPQAMPAAPRPCHGPGRLGSGGGGCFT